MGLYMLDEQGNPVACKDTRAWAEWFEVADRKRVAWDQITPDVLVSTVFLGIDHGFGEGPPVLWETMIFGGPLDRFQERYTSRDDAIAGHERALTIATGVRVQDYVAVHVCNPTAIP